jgi:uncharacterized protein (TIGR02757 family)
MTTFPNLKNDLDELYCKYNQRKYVHPDPLEFLYAYPEIKDREIAGLVASALAYGRVAQILKSVSYVLKIMGKSPYNFLKTADYNYLCKSFKNFRHRFSDGTNISAFLWGIKTVIERFGSIYNCFNKGLSVDDENLMPAMSFFVSHLTEKGKDYGHLVANPEKKSACKRMNLFLRWMIRKDHVDPGGWEDIPASKLIVPIDTHMYKIGCALHFTKRKQTDMKTAIEITSAFKHILPEDPVKYDFILTRLGIRTDMEIPPENLFYNICNTQKP